MSRLWVKAVPIVIIENGNQAEVSTVDDKAFWTEYTTPQSVGIAVTEALNYAQANGIPIFRDVFRIMVQFTIDKPEGMH